MRKGVHLKVENLKIFAYPDKREVLNQFSVFMGHVPYAKSIFFGLPS